MKPTNKFLNHIIALYQQIHRDDYVMIVDRDYQICFISPRFAQSMATTAEQLLGQNYLNSLAIPEEIKNSVKTSIKHNLSCSHTHEFLNINLNREHDEQILQMRYNPLLDPSSNAVVAVVIEGSKLSAHTSLYNFVTHLLERNASSANTAIDISHSDDRLTKREHEIAFLLLFFRSPKKIAEVIKQISGDEVSAKTINNIISSKLFVKLEVYNIDALITRLHELNYQTKIPASFMRNLHLGLT
jgi:hypothetical protein